MLKMDGYKILNLCLLRLEYLSECVLVKVWNIDQMEKPNLHDN